MLKIGDLYRQFKEEMEEFRGHTQYIRAFMAFIKDPATQILGLLILGIVIYIYLFLEAFYFIVFSGR